MLQPRTFAHVFRPTFRPISIRNVPSNTLLRLPTKPSVATPTTASFSSSARLLKKNKGGPKKDARITQIRYHLQHPKTPRPLRFSRLRALRHWTIHRAWQLYKAKARNAQQLDLERQYNSMRSACEALRLLDENGMVGGEAAKTTGRLYRTAMMKNDVWQGVPIEYARAQTDYPSKEGWNHGWTR